MKKLITLLLSLMLIFAFASCGGSGDSSSDNTDEPEVIKIEKNIDATAEALGLTEGEETYYQMIGAVAGKEYNDGAIELYQFEEDSEEYKEIEESGAIYGLDVAAHKDGIVLIFVTGEDQAILDEFNQIQYK